MNINTQFLAISLTLSILLFLFVGAILKTNQPLTDFFLCAIFVQLILKNINFNNYKSS